MALQSTDIDAALAAMAQTLLRLRAEGQQVKNTTNRAVSELSQFATDYAEVISAVQALSSSLDPVDQLQVARLAKVVAEATTLYTQVLAAKNVIDQLGL